MAEKMKDNAVKFLADKEATGCGYFPGKSGSRRGPKPYMYRYFPGANKKRKLPHKYFALQGGDPKIKSDHVPG